ncbi:MAG: hypothetical protein ABI187_07820 [Ornithinibacter sp.]
MKKLLLVLGLGVGYVLGTRAGRARYEQLRTTYEKVRGDDRVQAAASKAAEAAAAAAPVVKEKVAAVADSAVHMVRGGSEDSAPDAEVGVEPGERS